MICQLSQDSRVRRFKVSPVRLCCLLSRRLIGSVGWKRGSAALGGEDEKGWRILMDKMRAIGLYVFIAAPIGRDLSTGVSRSRDDFNFLSLSPSLNLGAQGFRTNHIMLAVEQKTFKGQALRFRFLFTTANQTEIIIGRPRTALEYTQMIMIIIHPKALLMEHTTPARRDPPRELRVSQREPRCCGRIVGPAGGVPLLEWPFRFGHRKRIADPDPNGQIRAASVEPRSCDCNSN